MNQANIERRIAKHVKARSHKVAAVCHPAIVDLAMKELKGLGFAVNEEASGVLNLRIGY